jgi:hypothetical protein
MRLLLAVTLAALVGCASPSGTADRSSPGADGGAAADLADAATAADSRDAVTAPDAPVPADRPLPADDRPARDAPDGDLPSDSVAGDPGADTAADATPGPDAPGARIEVGTGELAYEDITDGELVGLQCGPQGGMHIWTSLRLYGFPRSAGSGGQPEVDVNLTLGILRLDDMTVIGGLSSAFRASMVSATDPVELVGITNYLNVPLSEADGRPLRLTAEVTHASGIDVSDISADFVGQIASSCPGH